MNRPDSENSETIQQRPKLVNRCSKRSRLARRRLPKIDRHKIIAKVCTEDLKRICFKKGPDPQNLLLCNISLNLFQSIRPMYPKKIIDYLHFNYLKTYGSLSSTFSFRVYSFLNISSFLSLKTRQLFVSKPPI